MTVRKILLLMVLVALTGIIPAAPKPLLRRT